MRVMYLAVRNVNTPDILELMSCSVGNCPKKTSKAVELNRRTIKVKLLGPYTAGQKIDKRATKGGLTLQEFTCIKNKDNTYSLIGCKGDQWFCAKNVPTLKNAQMGALYKSLDLHGYDPEYFVIREMEELNEFRNY